MIFENRNIDRKPIRINLRDARYPHRVKAVMGAKTPKHLDMVGNLELLDIASLGICGSRKATSEGLKITRVCAEQAARGNVVVVSGNATGVDLKSHFECLEAGGKTILVLPEGINHFRIRRDIEPVWDWKRVLVVSQFEPSDPWTGFRAMMRNKLIVSLSRAMIVIEAAEKGGSFGAGKDALECGLPLYVAHYQDMPVTARGNQILLGMGARKLSKSRTTNEPNLTEVFKSVAEDRVHGIPYQPEIRFG